MRPRFFLLFLFACIVALGLPREARADGIIIPEPPPCLDDCPPFPSPIVQLEIRYHHVDVTIEDQIAVTRVDQVFRNPNDWPVEGTYVFPLPLDAAVSSFTLWIDGEPVKGEVLEASEARRIYEDIVRSMQDPALLEYSGRGAVTASVFPIPPGGERRIQLEYTQALTADQGLVRYTYPLNTEKFSLTPLDEVSISVEVNSPSPVRAIYSPTHSIATERLSETRFRAGYEEMNVTPDADFTLYYSLGNTEAFHLLSYRDPSDEADPDGFFLVLLAPDPDVSSRPLPKDLILVLDRSGSMDGEKIQQATAALRYILQNLNSGDRFNIVSFSTGLDTYANSLRPAADAPEAQNWIDAQVAEGATDINRALLEAASFVDPERPTYLIFLTDGLPTEGVTDSPSILQNFSQSAPSNLRLFSFGVGYDVDTFLLDSLSQEHQGLSTYVAPGEPLDEILSAFYAKISTPVLTDLDLDFGDISVYDLYPNPLPDLFLGSQIVAVGRYRSGGETDITLAARLAGESTTFRFEDQRFMRSSAGETGPLASLPRLWATRKIGYLLNQTRLSGPDQETIDQIVRLSIRYGIVTPYTSYLVTEPLPLGAAEQERIADKQFDQLQAMPTIVSGQEAVEQAAGQSSLQRAEAPAPPPSAAANGRVRIVASRTFVLNEKVWIDTAYDPQSMTPRKVAFLSDDYFELAQSSPEVAAALALGDRVILVTSQGVFEVIPAGESAPPLQLDDPQPNPVETDPPQPVDLPTPAPLQPAPPSRPASGFPCLGGFLPLLFALLALVLLRR